MFFTLSVISLSKLLTKDKNQLSLYSGIIGFVLYIVLYIYFRQPNIIFYAIIPDLIIATVVLNTLLVSQREVPLQILDKVSVYTESESDECSSDEFHDTDIDTEETIETIEIKSFIAEQPEVIPT